MDASSPERSVVRPFFASLPFEGDPVFITYEAHFAEAQRFSVIGDVGQLRSFASPMQLLQEVGERAPAGGQAN